MEPVLQKKISVVSGAFLVCLLLFVGFLGFWFANGKLEESVTAHGQLQPEGRLQRVMASSPGIVARVLVHENMAVKAGDVLFELDPESSDIEQSSLSLQLAQMRDEARTLRSAYLGQAPTASATGFGDLQNAWLQANRQTLAAQMESSKLEINRLQHDYQESLSRQENTAALLKSNEALLERYEALYKTGGISRNELESFEQKVMMQRGEANALSEQVASRKMAMAQAHSQPDIQLGTYRQNLLDRLTDMEQRIVVLDRDMRKAQLAGKRTAITAPVDGVVNELAVRGVNEVVQAGDTLVSIVPQDTALVAEVKVPNRDLSFIHIGQSAQLMLDAFPYQQFGRLSGEVISISPSALTDEKGQPYYLVRIQPERSQMARDGRPQPLVSGMTLNANLVTRYRNLFSFITEPVTHHVEQALKEPSVR